MRIDLEHLGDAAEGDKNIGFRDDPERGIGSFQGQHVQPYSGRNSRRSGVTPIESHRKNEAYRAVDWRTDFLLGGQIPLGMAMDQTGTAEWVARGIVIRLGTMK